MTAYFSFGIIKSQKNNSKFKDMKYIGPLLKNPAIKLFASGCGAAMAFFALITGISKAIRNGRIAVGDLKDRFIALG